MMVRPSGNPTSFGPRTLNLVLHIPNAPVLISSPAVELNDIRVVWVEAALRIQAFSDSLVAAEAFAIACLEISGDSPLTQCKLFQIIEQREPAQNPRRCVDGRLTDNLRLREVCRHRGPVCALESILLQAQVQLLWFRASRPYF